MARLEGFAKGKPKFFQISKKEKQIPPCDYYIARVLITGLKKNRAFPLQSIEDEDGARQFTNDLVGKKLIIDKTALEDLVEFQSVSYKVIEGVYWDEGFNLRICKVMPELYNERMKLKALGNPLQQCLKLLMNASFSKKIQKPIVTKKRFIVGADEIKKYTKKNICKLLSRTTITDNVSLFEEVKPISQHFSPAHLGAQLLSMSKRIMNEAMCLAEDIGQLSTIKTLILVMWRADTTKR
ncbi:hypothetical protein GN244_ATG09911 [Phytophthora infestans]|uniref:Uncharacterized protein n=1 Tax=Phytophthora infestans TaxID=4787 RepID=A0A833SA30_PHYIN|nr:hypothetical protein GN244_ATG09911 [Phytophthora infestans]